MYMKTKSFFEKLKTLYKAHQKEQQLLADFRKDIAKYNAEAPANAQVKEELLFPCLYDNTETTNNIEPTYFYQDSWAFERIIADKPTKHIDIGSHHKFVALLSKVVDLTMVDIRPLSLPLNTIKFLKGSILDLPFEDNSVESLSSICVVEHIGLGRYGDPIDPHGSKKALDEIHRVLKVGGNFYMSVPVEKENKIYFNAHRAFNEEYLLNELLSEYEVIDKAYIYQYEFCRDLRDRFGTGCYHLRKIK